MEGQNPDYLPTNEYQNKGKQPTLAYRQIRYPHPPPHQPKTNRPVPSPFSHWQETIWGGSLESGEGGELHGICGGKRN